MKTHLIIIVYLIFMGLISCEEDINSGLVAYYPFNGNAKDQSGNGNDGVIDGAIGTENRFNQENSAFRFDGVGSAILAKVTEMPAVNSAQTISWWFMIDQPPVYNDSVGADNMFALVDTVSGVGVQAGYRAPGYHSLGLDTWYWGGRTVLESPQPALNQWHHCVYTYDGKTHRFYLDGRETAKSEAEPQKGKPDVLMLGNYPGGDQFFQGNLDDIRIYTRVLIQSEIDVLYKAKE